MTVTKSASCILQYSSYFYSFIFFNHSMDFLIHYKSSSFLVIFFIFHLSLSTLDKFTDTKLGGVIDTLKGCAAI